MSTPKPFLLLLAVALFLPIGAFASPITFNVFVQQSNINTTLAGGDTQVIGFAYAGNKFVGSVYPNNSQLYQTDLSGGSVAKFGTPILGANSELYVSSSLGLGGFPNHDIYASAGPGNGLYRFSNDGSTQGAFTVSGSGAALNGEYVKGIAFDPYGNYGFDMLVTTNSGSLYNVDSTGNATLLASVPNAVLEGLDFAPTGFGPFGGDVVVASENNSTLFAVSPGGTVTNLRTALNPLDGNNPYGVVIPAAEEIGFVPVGIGSGSSLQGFYAASYPYGGIEKADGSQFTGMVGDAIVTGELGGCCNPASQVHWNGTKFVVTNPIGQLSGQAEDGIFVTQALVNTATVPEPGTLFLLGSGLLVTARRLRRK